MVQMSQVIFDKPYPLPQKRSWKLTALQRLLSRFYQKRRDSRHEHTGLLSRGRDRFPGAVDTSHHFLYKRHKLESPPGSAPLNLHPRSHDRDRRRQNENSSSSLFVEPSRGLCPSTLCIALTDATDISRSTGLRRTNSVRNLRVLVHEAAIAAKADIKATCNTSTVSVPEMPTKFLIDFLEGRAAIENLDHFNAFLIVSTTAQGDRVLYASEGLWSGEDFENEEHFLHHKRALDQTNDIITEIADDGSERMHLMLFGGLPSTGGRTGLVLASLIDVTNFLDALTYSDLEIDVLIRHINSTSPQDVGPENKPENPSETSDVMRQLVNHVAKSILALYKDYFILSQSANAPGFYEISHVSPNLYVDGEYVTGHLSHTPQDVISRISLMMGQGKRFFLEVKWGSHGREKRLYCIPMLSMGRRRWLCMLVDLIHPILWQEE
ncbi:hypothetical protein RJZ56_000205 [Blastomyces dermatitidis]|uniref:Uncharacterized protein n=1 Tax=Blastomyces gilchristii (strain SLH14081) TaxID=559298 RepID=A0A179UWM6_BLAGS|nr:uncharacterized protein BDBG_07600 [Blastomyces gilchristii SLH14081]OAT12223.1 hypothetical protein BDBG_07600 [Blastomyces gilchristii SLH14081]